MKPPKFAYVRAESLPHALELLSDGESQPLAGGQSLVPAMNFRLAAPVRLVDLNRLDALRRIELLPGGDVRIGAMARHRDVELDPIVRERLPMLSHAMREVAHVAIRHRGTIGGSLAHGDPAADWPALCVASRAAITLASADGEREVAAEDFSVDMFTTALRPGELVTAIRFPAWPASRRWDVRKTTRRRGDFAIVGVALTVDLDAAGACTDARIVLQGVAGRPVVAAGAGQVLLGRRPDAALVAAAARAARDAAEPGSDLHASAELRTMLMETLTRRGLARALGLAEDGHG